MTARPMRSGRVLIGALLLGAVGAALAPGGPDALMPFKLLAASAAQTIGVAVVVDFGNGTVTSSCAHVPAGSSDYQALAAVYPVVTNSAGLICDINNVPTSDTSQCLRSAGNGQFYFWSYFQGSSGVWQYSSVGPGAYVGPSDDVEGWRFQNPGPDNSTAPGPAATPNYAAICGAPITTTAPAPPPPAPATPPTATFNPPVSATTGKAATGTGHVTTTTMKKTGTTPSTSVGGARGSTATAGAHTSTTVANSSGPGRHTRAALASASVSSAPVLPVVLILAVIAILAGLGYYRWRRRPAEE